MAHTPPTSGLYVRKSYATHKRARSTLSLPPSSALLTTASQARHAPRLRPSTRGAGRSCRAPRFSPYLFTLKLLLYLNVIVSAKGVGCGRVEPVAFVGKWRVGIEDVVNTEG
jgi:hypothetical protein